MTSHGGCAHVFYHTQYLVTNSDFKIIETSDYRESVQGDTDM